MDQVAETDKFTDSDFSIVFSMLKAGLETISLSLSEEDYETYQEIFSKFLEEGN